MKRSETWWSQALHNRLIALILAMIVVVPLIATPLNNSLNGVAALGYEGMGIALLGVLLWRAQWKVKKEDVLTFLKTGANLPLLLFLAVAGVSCVFAPYKQYGEQELLRLGTGVLLYFAIAYQFRRSEYLTKLVDTLIFVGIGGALLGFAQFASDSQHHAVGMFGDHQLFGSFLMILLPLIGTVALAEKRPNRQLTAQVATVLVGTALLVSQARSAWLGTGAGLATLAGLSLWMSSRTKGVKTRPAMVLPAMMLAVSLGFFLLISPLTSNILGRATTLGSASHIHTLQTRQHTWEGASRMIQARPLTGWGIGQYSVLQNQYTHDGLPIAELGMAASLSEQAHNWYLQTAAELGIPGLLLMVGALVTFFVSGVKRMGQMDAGIRRSLLMGSLAGVAAFAVDAVGSPSWQCGQVSMFLWLTLGLGAACMRPLPRKREESSAASVKDLRPNRLFALAAMAGVVFLLPTVGVSAVGGYTNFQIRPGFSTLRSGRSLTYSLFVTYTNSSNVSTQVDVSSQTLFSASGGGAFSGRVFTASTTTTQVVTITGTFQGQSASTSLRVRP